LATLDQKTAGLLELESEVPITETQHPKT